MFNVHQMKMNNLDVYTIFCSLIQHAHPHPTIKHFQSITIYLHLLLIDAFPHVDMTKSLPKGSQSKLKMVHGNGV